jgi:hypothetical protein
MRKTWIAVLTGALGVWGGGAFADDASAPRTPWKILPSGLSASQAVQPPEKIKAPTPVGPEKIPSPKPETPAAPAPTAPTVAELAPHSAPVGGGTCAPACGACESSHCWERLKAWACYHSVSGKLCADHCCGGQRWVPVYLFFLTPPCQEGCGPVCGAACAPTCGSCAAPVQPVVSKAPSAHAITPCKAVSPAPCAAPPAQTSCDTPCGLVTPKAKDGCGGSCGPVAGPCGSSWSFTDFAHRMFGPPTGLNNR